MVIEQGKPATCSLQQLNSFRPVPQLFRWSVLLPMLFGGGLMVSIPLL